MNKKYTKIIKTTIKKFQKTIKFNEHINYIISLSIKKKRSLIEIFNKFNKKIFINMNIN